MIKKHILIWVMILISIVVATSNLLPVMAEGVADTRQQQVKDSLKEVYNSGEFNQFKEQSQLTKYLKEKLEELKKWLIEKFTPKDSVQISFQKAIQNAIEGILKNASIIRIIAFFLAIMFFIIIIYFGVRKIRFGSRLIKKTDEELLISMLKDPDLLIENAQKFYEKGLYKEAIRFLYIAFLLRLNEKNFVRINKAKTNRQYLGELRMNQYERLDRAYQFTEAYNFIWYGNRIAQKEDYELWYQEYTFAKNGGVS